MNDAQDRLRRFMAAQAAADRPVIVGFGVTVAWLVLVAAFWLAGPAGDGTGRLASAAAILMPLALIWLAVGLARAIAGLRAEATELRAELVRLQARQAGPDADIPPQPTRVEPPMPRQAPPRPAPERTDSRQTALHLDTPEPPRITAPELIRALNFPDGPDDTAAIAALRAALADPDTRRLIRAAQDVVTLMARQGLYMDDLPVSGDGALWRRYAEGQRGATVSGLARGNEGARDLAVELMRGDDIFRDAAHHFLRQFDRLMTRLSAELDDAGLAHLADTRSGRAFTLLARTTGVFG